MLLQTIIGNEIWPIGQTKVHLFMCPTHDYPLNGKEEHLFLVARNSGRPGFPTVAQINNSTTPAGRGMDATAVGKWTLGTYDLPENLLLKLMLSRSTVSPPGQRAASILLKTRESAALRRITITTLQTPKSNIGSLMFEGKFDIVDLGEAERLGFTPSPQYMPTYLASRYSQLPYLQFRELAPETRSEARVSNRVTRNTSGEQVTVPVVRQRRALDL